MYENCNSAIRILSAILRKQGYGVSEIYFKHWVNNHLAPPTDKEKSLLLETVQKEKPDIVAFSIRCSAYEGVADELTEFLAERFEAFYLWGGLHPTLSPERCITRADALILGEAEIALPQFMQAFENGDSLDAVSNLWTSENHGNIRNPVTTMEHELDKIPFRDYSAKGKYYIIRDKVTEGDPAGKSAFYTVMASRGCPFGCTYCFNHVFREFSKEAGRYFRIRSVDNLLSEISLAIKNNPNIKSIRFDDNIFPFKKAWVDEFCAKYPKEVGIPFEALLQPNVIYDGLLRQLKGAGLRAVTTGIQSTEKVNYELYDRRVQNKKLYEFADQAREAGLPVRFQIVIDNPLSDHRELEDMYHILREFRRPYDLYLFSLTNYPNTEMTKRLLQEGKISEDEVEGPGTKTFAQYRVSLNWPRPRIETFWIALFILMNKRYVPASLIELFARSNYLKKHPKPLVMFAQATNLLKMGMTAMKLVLRGEMTPELIRQWLNFKSVITS